MSTRQLHLDFKLNGFSFSKKTLKDAAYSFIKEGEPYERVIGDFLMDWLDGSSIVEVKTSGSTGIPKQIQLQKQQMVNSALATGEFFGLQPSDTALLCLPASYIAGKMMLVRAMVLGLEIDYVEPATKPLTGLSKDYDFAAMVPLQLEESLDDIERIKTIIVGGAPISQVLQKKAQEKNTAIFETYGMTETITHVAVKNVMQNAVESQINFKALPNVLFTKDDRDCLVISAPKVADEAIVTNDIINLMSETEFEWLGRYDNVINSGGIKLFPEQIEAKLTDDIINRFFVAGLEDEVLGQKLVLVVEGSSSATSILEKIKQNKALERFEIPKAVFLLPQFVTTSNCKIQRTETLRLLNS